LNESKKILLTGATGLVGSAILKAFLGKGFFVKGISRNKQPKLKNAEWVIADIAGEKINLQKHLEGVDVVVHNAACLYLGNTEIEKVALQKTNIDFTEQLFESAGRQGIQKVVFTSSFSFIAKPLPELITETAVTMPISAYAVSKLLGEGLVKEKASKYGFQYNILRLSSPVSFDLDIMPSTVVRKWLEQSLAGQHIQVFGKGTRTQDFVALPDIADAFVNCIQQDEVSGIFNIASGSAISMLELAKMICEKFSNQYQCCGEDVNEKDRWNISIKKAQQQLNYVPKYNSTQTITAILNNI
jgi:UDP-glucose 4-epimerase